MKAKTIKNKILLSVVLFGLACICLLAGWALQPRKATAAEPQTGITFVEGASVRIDTDGETSGIRFSARFGKDVYDKIYDEQGNNKTGAELGMIIAPHSYVEGVTTADWFTYFKEEYDMEKSQISMQFSSKKVIDKGEGVYQVNGAMVKVKEKNWDRDFRAILYYTTDNGATYTYQVNEDARNVTDISITAIQKESERADGDYKDNELSVLYNYANGNIPRVMYDAKKQTHETKFTQMLTSEVTSVSASSLTSVEYEGEQWFEISVDAIDESGKASALGYKVSLDGLDLSLYDYFIFRMRTEKSGVQYQLADANLNTIEAQPWESFVAGEEVVVKIPVGQYEQLKDNYYFCINNLSVGDKVYLSDFVAHGAKSVSYMIDGLPQEGFISIPERGEVCTADKYHDALSSTAKEQVRNQAELEISKTLPIVVYEAGVDNDKFKKLTLDENGTPITVDGGAPEGDTDAFKFEKSPIQIDETMYAWAYTYTLTGNEKDLGDYAFVTFNAWTNGIPGNFLVVNADMENLFVSDQLTAEKTAISLKMDLFLGGANGQLMIAFVSQSADAVFYMSDVRAFGVASLEGMIGRLAEGKDSDMTAPDQLSLTEINNYVEILETVADKAISSSSKQDLIRTEGRPYNVLDTTTEGATGRFIPIALENDGNGWAAEITTVREAGLNWFKFTLTQKGKNGILAYKVNMGAEDIGVNLDGYSMIALKFRADGLGNLLSNGEGASVNIAMENEDTDENENTKNLVWTPDGTLQITPLIKYTEMAASPTEILTTFQDGYLILSGLNVGDSIYISDFICYNLYTAMTMIEKLPYVNSVQESDYNAVQKARAYLNQLSQGSNATFADVGAMEAYAEESEKIERTFYTGYINALSDKFQALEDYFTEQTHVPILPAGDPTANEAFVSVPVQADGVVGWSGTTESVTIDGEDWIEMSIEEIGTNQTLYFKLNLMDYIADFSDIDYVAFTIKSTNENAAISISVGETDGMIPGGDSGIDLGDAQVENIVLGEDGYTLKVGYSALALLSIVMEYVDVSYTYKVTGLEVGDSVYVSSVKAYKKAHTQTIVDNLPLASTITGAEILEYKEQIDLTRAEVNDNPNKDSLNLTNLKALEFKLFEYYLGLLPTVTMDTAIDISSRSVEDIEILKNIRKYYVAFRASSSDTIYTTLKNRGYTEDQATAAGDKWLNNEVVIFQVLLHAIDVDENGVANGEYVVTADNVYLVEDAMSCYVELKGHKTKGSTMQWVQNPGGGFLNGTFVSIPAQYADGKLTNEQKNLVKDLYGQALQAYVNALPAAEEITLEDEAEILATREWLLARQELASSNGSVNGYNYGAANRLLGEREVALLQLYIDNMADPSTVTLNSEVAVAKVRTYYTLLEDTYEISVYKYDVDSTRLLQSELALLREKLAIMPTVDAVTVDHLKAVERIYLSAVNVMELDSIEAIDVTVAAAQLFIQVVQLELDSLPLPEQLDRMSLIKYQGVQALIEELYLLVPNPEWVLDLSHAMPSFLAATYLDTLNHLDEEPTDSFSDESDTKKALQAFLDMIEYDASLATKVETDTLYKNVTALLKYYWNEFTTLNLDEEKNHQYIVNGTSPYYTAMTNGRWLYDLMQSYGFSPDGIVDIEQLLKYEKVLLKNYISALPDVSSVTIANADSIRNTRELFDRLQAANVDVSEIWTNEQMQAYESALELAQLFNLPEASAITLEHQAQIENARAIYEQLKAAGTDVSAYEDKLKACEVALLGAKIRNVDILSCTKAEIQALRDEYQAKLDVGYDVSSIKVDLEDLEYEWVMMSAAQSIFYEAVGKDSMQPIGDAYAYMQSMTIDMELVQEVALYAFITLRLQIQNLPEAEEVTLADGEKIMSTVTLGNMLTEAGIPVEEMLEEEYKAKLIACKEALDALTA